MMKIKWLRRSLLMLSILCFTMSQLVIAGKSDEKTMRINPDFKITRISDGTVVVTSKKPDEANVRHEFTDFYADLLMAAYRKQSINAITDSLRKKYYMSEDECRRELKHALNTLAEWKIILREQDLAHKYH